MYKTEITYKDYNDIERTETLYFGFNKLEILKMQAKRNGGFVEYLTRISKALQVEELMNTYEELMEMSYGVKSDDGVSFVKSKEVFEKFKSSPAYSEFLMKLLVNENNDVEKFINGIMPAEYVSEIEKEIKKNKDLMIQKSGDDNNANSNNNS